MGTVLIPSVYNALDGNGTGYYTRALSAYQGYVLNGKIAQVSGNIPTVYNGLDKTTYQSTVALSAYQGKVLLDKINAVDQKIGNTKLNTETWTFTLANGTTVTKKVAIG